MSRFFVGQRVKLVRPHHASCMGSTGRITEMFPERDGFTYRINCDVRWDDQLSFNSRTHTSRLEPILPEGEQPSEFTTLHDLLDSLEGIAA